MSVADERSSENHLGASHPSTARPSGPTDFEAALRDVNRAAARVAPAVEQVERGLSDPDAAAALIRDCVERYIALRGGTAPLTPLQRRKLELKIDEMKFQESTLQRAATKMERTARARIEREQLLGSSASRSGNVAGLDDSAVAHLAKEEAALRHTRNKVRAMVDESAAVLGALRSQRRTLSHTHGRLGSFLEGLGVSNQALQQITQMGRTDALIVYTGIALVVVVMLYLWFR